ncbi:hypothetical protein LCGC14_0456950 [marine sediment metagenome]|uniref:Uncharacterized protein n=1 Tax=marine sediment metagenome TaxID=412755 RepID=A0A0F9VQ71_9ZZZZ
MGYITYCTSTIVDDARISDNVLRTFLCISNFLKADGFAYCSNEWLCNKRDLEPRSVRRHLESMEKAGYIWREMWSDGLKRKRRIWLPEKYLMHLEVSKLEDPEFRKFLSDGQYERCDDFEEKFTKRTSSVPIEEDRDVRLQEDKDDPSYIRRNKKAELESSSKEPPIVHNSEPPNPQPAAAAAASCCKTSHVDLPKIVTDLPENERELVIALFWKKNAKKTIDDPAGWMVACVQGGWHLKKQFEPPPPPEPESVVNKRANTLYANYVIKKLECVPNIDSWLVSNFLIITHTDGGHNDLNLAQSSYSFRARVYQVLKNLKLSPELYLADQQNGEDKKEDITLN